MVILITFSAQHVLTNVPAALVQLSANALSVPATIQSTISCYMQPPFVITVALQTSIKI